MDIKSAMIMETATKIVKQVSNWRSAGKKRVRWEPRTTWTTRNALNELSWERAKPRSLADGTETNLVLRRLVTADDSHELIKRIGHETVNENLNKAVMNDPNSDVNSGVSSEEPEFAWTVLCQRTTQKSVRKTDTNWTARGSEEQECFQLRSRECGEVECAQQDVGSFSAIQFESYTWNTGGARTIHTNYLDRNRIEQWMTKRRFMIVGAWAGEQWPVVSSTGLAIGEDLFESHSWTTGVALPTKVGVGLLCCVCAVFNPDLPTRSVQVTREPEVARQPSGMIQREKEDVESLMVFWRSAVAADGDVECAVLSKCTGTVVAAHCHHE